MNKNLKAGIFVVITAIILIFVFLWANRFQFRKEGYTVFVHFPDVTGLKRRDPVRVYGVDKGEVKEITFHKDYVNVVLRMDNDVVIYTDARAYIKDVAMISGTKYVELDPGKSGEKLPPEQPILGSPSLGIPLSLIGEIGENIKQLLNPLQQRDIASSINSLIQSLTQLSNNLRNITAKNEKPIEQALQNIEEATKEAKITLRKLSKTSSLADTVLSNIKNGKGTIGKLANSDSVYIELHKSLKAIRELTEDIKQNPKRYLKIL